MHSSVRELRSDLLERVGHGEHLILYGPRGSGKSTLVWQLHARFARVRIPCGVAQYTACLEHITCAMEAAYPKVNTQAVARRTARGRPRHAADQRGCVLLLDHLSKVSTAMVGFCRRLRGGVAGILREGVGAKGHETQDSLSAAVWSKGDAGHSSHRAANRVLRRHAAMLAATSHAEIPRDSIHAVRGEASEGS